MTPAIDHARCSELLRPYRAGELDRDLTEQVRTHLEGCPQCRAEESALAALTGAGQEGLTARERTALRHGVMVAIDADPDELAPHRNRRARLAQVLGAAAAMTVFGTLLYLSATSGGQGGDTTAASMAESQEDAAGRAAEPSAFSNVSGSAAKSGGASEGFEAPPGDAAADSAADAPSPTFSVAQEPLSGDDLELLGRSGSETVRFARYYDAADASGAPELVEQLAAAARATVGANEATQVQECSAQVLESQDPTLPAFGMVGAYEDRDVLILGFIWSPRATGALDRYMVWAWERDSCEVTVDYIEGRVETAP